MESRGGYLFDEHAVGGDVVDLHQGRTVRVKHRVPLEQTNHSNM